MLLPAVMDMGPSGAYISYPHISGRPNTMLPNVALLVAVIEAVLRVMPVTCSVCVPGAWLRMPILLPL